MILAGRILVAVVVANTILVGFVEVLPAGVPDVLEVLLGGTIWLGCFGAALEAFSEKEGRTRL